MATGGWLNKMTSHCKVFCPLRFDFGNKVTSVIWFVVCGVQGIRYNSNFRFIYTCNFASEINPWRSRVRDPMKFTGSDDVTVGHYKAKRDEAVVMTSQVSGLASHLVHHRDVISCPELPRRFFTSCWRWWSGWSSRWTKKSWRTLPERLSGRSRSPTTPIRSTRSIRSLRKPTDLLRHPEDKNVTLASCR